MTHDQASLLRQVRVALQKENYPKAIYWLEEAVKLARQEGDSSAEGRHVGNLALIYYRLGQHDLALEGFQRALNAARADDDRSTEEGLLGNIGNILREMGRHIEALDYLNQALLISQEIGDVRGRGIWLSNLGLVYDDMGRYVDAIPLHYSAVEVARQINDQRGLSARLGHLGNSYVALGDFLAAVEYFRAASDVHRQLGDQAALAQRLGIIGNLYSKLARSVQNLNERAEYFHQARAHYEQTLELAQSLGDAHSEVELLRVLGAMCAEEGDYDAAAAYLENAQTHYQQAGAVEQQQVVTSLLTAVQRLRKIRR
jgi:tetratricopeptide (TPR) repeat protein